MYVVLLKSINILVVGIGGVGITMKAVVCGDTKERIYEIRVNGSSLMAREIHHIWPISREALGRIGS